MDAAPRDYDKPDTDGQIHVKFADEFGKQLVTVNYFEQLNCQMPTEASAQHDDMERNQQQEPVMEQIPLDSIPATVVAVNVDGLLRTENNIVMDSVKDLYRVQHFRDLVLKAKDCRGKLQELGCFSNVDTQIGSSDTGESDYVVTFYVQELKKAPQDQEEDQAFDEEEEVKTIRKESDKLSETSPKHAENSPQVEEPTKEAENVKVGADHVEFEGSNGAWDRSEEEDWEKPSDKLMDRVNMVMVERARQEVPSGSLKKRRTQKESGPVRKSRRLVANPLLRVDLESSPQTDAEWKQPYQCHYCRTRFGWTADRDSHELHCESVEEEENQLAGGSQEGLWLRKDGETEWSTPEQVEVGSPDSAAQEPSVALIVVGTRPDTLECREDSIVIETEESYRRNLPEKPHSQDTSDFGLAGPRLLSTSPPASLVAMPVCANNLDNHLGNHGVLGGDENINEELIDQKTGEKISFKFPDVAREASARENTDRKERKQGNCLKDQEFEKTLNEFWVWKPEQEKPAWWLKEDDKEEDLFENDQEDMQVVRVLPRGKKGPVPQEKCEYELIREQIIAERKAMFKDLFADIQQSSREIIEGNKKRKREVACESKSNQKKKMERIVDNYGERRSLRDLARVNYAKQDEGEAGEKRKARRNETSKSNDNIKDRVPLPKTWKPNWNPIFNPVQGTDNSDSSSESVANVVRRSNRPRKMPNYRDPPSDEYIFCERCQEDKHHGCDVHPVIFNIKAEMSIGMSKAGKDAGRGVFATGTIPEGVLFGPYEGTFHTTSKYNKLKKQRGESGYAWEIRDQYKMKVVGFVDPGPNPDPHRHWMSMVNMSPKTRNENMVAVQYCGQIFYMTVAEIPPGQECLINYGDPYAKELKINLAEKGLLRIK